MLAPKRNLRPSVIYETQRIVDRVKQLRRRTGGVMLIANGYPEVETSATENLECTSLESTSTIEVSPAASTADGGVKLATLTAYRGARRSHQTRQKKGSVTRTESSGVVSASRLTMEVQQWVSNSQGSDDSYIAALLDGEADIEMEGEIMSDV
jgi:hypothetical protein